VHLVDSVLDSCDWAVCGADIAGADASGDSASGNPDAVEDKGRQDQLQDGRADRSGADDIGRQSGV